MPMRIVIYKQDGITITQQDVNTSTGVVRMIIIEDTLGNLVRMEEVQFRRILAGMTDTEGMPTY